MMNGALRGLVMSFVSLVLAVPATLGGEAPYWPSEREARLAVVEERIFETMSKLAGANYEGRTEEVEHLREQLEALRQEQIRLREVPTYNEQAAQ